MTSESPSAPALRVVRGTPDETELAALVAVLAARGSGGDESAPARSAWADPARRLRRPLLPGPGAWRVSARAGGWSR